MISLVMPTYNEGAVIEETLRRVSAVLATLGEGYEVIVVDDASGDDTPEIAESLGRKLPVRVLRRPGRLGLASAVVDGWAMARGDLLGVMDADLQHPPQVLTALAGALRAPTVDLAIASRYVAGGGTGSWNWLRRLNSWAATHLAASVLPWTIASVSDPMSGMFLVRASALKDIALNPLGYKILLEVLAKARYCRFVEVPYVFEQRERGSSKAGARQGLEYLLHLGRLARSTKQLGAWVRYGLVGLSGAVIDLGGVYGLAGRLGVRLVVALGLAIQFALVSNFLWNQILTFRSRVAASDSLLQRFLRYELVCLPGALLNGLVTLIAAGHGAALPIAATLGVATGGVWNFAFNVPAIWRTWGSRLESEPRPGLSHSENAVS